MNHAPIGSLQGSSTYILFLQRRNAILFNPCQTARHCGLKQQVYASFIYLGICKIEGDLKV